MALRVLGVVAHRTNGIVHADEFKVLRLNENVAQRPHDVVTTPTSATVPLNCATKRAVATRHQRNSEALRLATLLVLYPQYPVVRRGNYSAMLRPSRKTCRIAISTGE
jgi:hypothetical protein